MKFEIFREQVKLNQLSAFASTPSDYRWRLLANNGESIATSGEGYKNKSDCQHALDLVKGTDSSTPVFDLTAQTINSLASAAKIM